MNQTTNQASHSPVRSEAAEALRSREMPLLFQLADTNRLPVKPPVAPVPSAAPPGPGPLAMSPQPGAFVPSATPLASTAPTAPSSWGHTPTGLFEFSAGFSTAGLTAGVTAKPNEPIVAAEPKHIVTEAKPATTEPASVPSTPTVETASNPSEPAAPITTLPKAIDEAVKAAEIAPAVAEPAKAVATEPAAATASETTTTAAAEAAPGAAAESTTDKPSPGSLRRERAAARQQKVEATKGDWLQSHGKIIAIGFVIALAGTIYMARRNRPSPEDSPNHEPVGLAIEVPGDGDTHDHHNHDPKSAEAANSAPRLVEAPSLPHDTPSPALTDPSRNTPATATAELHPPVMPAPASTAPAGNAPLFPWQNENRTATRPDAPASTAPALTAPAPSAPTGGPLSTPNAHAPPNGPALTPPAYPETNLRDAPLLPPAPASGPVSQPAGGQGSGRAPSSSFPASFTQAPGGTRYERTGSGLY